MEPGAGLVLGLALSVASTVVLLESAPAAERARLQHGRIAVGWLIVEDLAMVLRPGVPARPGGCDAGRRRDELSDMGTVQQLGITVGKIVLFVALALVGGRRLVPWLLERIARTGSRELFYPRGVGDCSGYRLRLGGAVRRVMTFRAGCVARGCAAVMNPGIEPSGRGGFAAAAGCVRGALLRVRGHVVRSPSISGARSAFRAFWLWFRGHRGGQV